MMEVATPVLPSKLQLTTAERDDIRRTVYSGKQIMDLIKDGTVTPATPVTDTVVFLSSTTR